MEKQYTSLREFYPYYLTEHQNFSSKALHFVGTGLFIAAAIYAIVSGNYWYFLFGPLIAYTFAWLGHFFFERNKPATFQYPLFSLLSDFIMWFHIATFQLPKKMKEARQTILGQKA
jgi:hypothetical protein